MRAERGVTPMMPAPGKWWGLPYRVRGNPAAPGHRLERTPAQHGCRRESVDTSATRPRTSLGSRVLGALRLNAATYAEVAEDQTATKQAVVIVTVAASMIGASQDFTETGNDIAILMRSTGLALAYFAVLILALAAIALALWIVHAGLLAVVSRWIEGIAMRQAFFRLLRSLGFAWTIQCFQVVTVVPAIGPWLGIAVSLWSMVASVLAVREAIRVTNGRALLISVVGGFAAVAIFIVAAVVWGVAVFQLIGS